MLKLYRLLLISVGILVALLLSACDQTPAAGEQVHVGYVEAEYLYKGAAEAGRVERLAVREGDRVAPGDLLFELDSERERAALAQAQAEAAEARATLEDLAVGVRPEELAQLEARLEDSRSRLALAEAEWRRSEPLLAQGVLDKLAGERLQAERERAAASVSADEAAIAAAKLAARDGRRRAAEAAVTAADARVRQRALALEQRQVHARRDGTVQLVLAREGERVTAGSPVLALLPESLRKVRFFLPQAVVPSVAPGAIVRVAADATSEQIPARVTYVADSAEFTPPVIYSAASRGKLVFAVEARLEGPSALPPGLPVDVHLP